MALRTAVLARAHLAPNTSVTLLTVPPGYTYIVKQANIWNEGANAVSVTFMLQDAGPVHFGVLFSQSISVTTPYTWSGFAVAAAGDSLIFQNNGNATVDVWVSGSKLLGNVS
jgi:hypothetical protein